MKRFLSLGRLRLLVLLTVVAVFSGCSSDTGTQPTEDLVIGGLVIRDQGVNVASVLGSLVAGEFLARDATTSRLLTVVFVDEEGVEFTPFADEFMMVSSENEVIATFVQEGTFTGRLNFLTVGETSITLSFVQGQTTIYTSPPIPVKVGGHS